MNNKEYMEIIIDQLKKEKNPVSSLSKIEDELSKGFFEGKYSFEDQEDIEHTITPEILSFIQELRLSLQEGRYDTGSYYTDSTLINRIINEENLWKRTVLDPACGTGNFPIKLILLFINNFTSKVDLVKYIEKYIFINELQKDSIEVFIKRLNFIVFDKFGEELSNEEIGIIKKNITIKDFLVEFDSGIKYDAIIGNPPYLGIKSLGERYRVDLKNEFGYVDDLYSLFVEKSSKLLEDNGFFSFVTSSTYMTISTKKRMRETLISKGLYRIEGNHKNHFDIQTKTATFYCRKKKQRKEVSIFIEEKDFKMKKTNIISLMEGIPTFPLEKINKNIEKEFKKVQPFLDTYKKEMRTTSSFKKFIETDDYAKLVRDNDILPLGLISFIATGVDFKGNNEIVIFSETNNKYNLLADAEEVKEELTPTDFRTGLDEKKYIKAIKGTEKLYVKWDKKTFQYLKKIGAPLRNLSLYGEEILYCKTSTYEFTKIDKNTLCINTAGASFIRPVIDISIDEILFQIENEEVKAYINNSINNSLCLTPNDLKKIPIRIKA